MRSLFAVLVCVLALSACQGKTPTVNVSLDPPIISTFTAEPMTIKVGATVTLRWDVAGANVEVRIDPAVGNVANVGSVTLAPTVSTTYTLNARFSSGASAQRVLTVVVTP